MSTFNATYNFNQGNMNFGQAIGYGLLGSLTGGMGMGGCFGGGFGSPFSMGGSLFSMMGCGGLGNMYGSPASFFGMGCYSDQMAGAQLGFIGVNLVTGLIGKAIEGRGSAKAEAKENAAVAQNNISALKSEISDLKTENQNLVHYQKDINSNITELTKLFPEEGKAYSNADTAYKKFNNQTAQTMDPYKGQINDINSSTTYTDAEKKEKIHNVEVKFEDDKLAAKNALEQAKKKLNEEITKKISANEQTKNEKETDLKKAQEQLEEAVASQTKKVKLSENANKILGKFNDDGTIAENNNLDNVTKENVKDYVQAFNATFSQYCKATTNEEKLKIAKKAKTLYGKINTPEFTDYITSDMKRNMKVMNGRVELGL